MRLSLPLVLLLLVGTACSSGGSGGPAAVGERPTGPVDGPGVDNDTVEDGVSVPDAGDTQDPTETDDGSEVQDDDGTPGTEVPTEACKTVCEPGECGYITDRCGGTVFCGDATQVCGPGFACQGGVCQEIPPQCSTTSPAEACAGKTCGFVAAGCGEVIDCGAVNGGCDAQRGFCRDHQCVDWPTPDPEDCPSLLTCDTAGVECGVASNGCGGTLDCGGAADRCQPGELCLGNRCLPPQQCVPALDKAAACAGRCGVVTDGCAGSYDCGAGGAGPEGTFCASGQVCVFGECRAPDDPPPTECDPGPINDTVCAALDRACGVLTDNCGAAVDCGTACDAPDEWCGGGGEALVDPTYGPIAASNLCGKPACEPLDDATACGAPGAGELCGLVSKGCGQFADCGTTCSVDGEFCGVDAGEPGRCAEVVCQPRPRATACAGVCGTVSDGCSGTYDCDAFDLASNCDAAAGEVCGGYGAAPGSCGTPPACVPATCAELGATCGFVSDGCEGQLDCTGGADNLGCSELTTCIGEPPTCQSDSDDGGCTGEYCTALPSCPAGQEVTIRGTVVTPGFVRGNGNVDNQFGIPNAFVYIPQSADTPLPPIVEGPQCDRCEDTDLGPVLVSAVSSPEGHFSLSGAIPTDVDSFRLVVKTGKWRRVVQVPTVGMDCGDTIVLDTQYTRLPRNQEDGEAGTNIPKIAVSTGSSDAMECVFYKMGLDVHEFTVQGETTGAGEGRVNLFGSDGNNLAGRRPSPTSCAGTFGAGTSCAAADNYGCNTAQPGCDWVLGPAADVDFVPEFELMSDYSMLDNYDMVVLDCHGGDHEEDHDAAVGSHGDANLLEYANRGGRVFMTHHSAYWIEANSDFSRAATIGGGYKGNGVEALSFDDPGKLRFGEPERLSDFANWLVEYAEPTGTWSADGSTYLNVDVKSNKKVEAIAAQGVHEWIWSGAKDGDEGEGPTQTFSFNTPYLTIPAGQPWCEAEPADTYCKDCGRVTYSSFHVSEKGDDDGSSIEDLCDDRADNPMDTQEKVLLYLLFDVAACTGDVPEPPQCEPTPDEEICDVPADGPNAGMTPCGYHANGCGALRNCSEPVDPCDANEFCDDGFCVEVGCTPQTCASLGFECGTHSDGCSGILECEQDTCSAGGDCPDGCDDTVVDQVCGLVNAGTCGTPSCLPRDVCEVGDDTDAVCGQLSNGCELVDCGGCPGALTCGAVEANRCGEGECIPLTCDDLRADTVRFPDGIECGQLSDGCGGVALDLDGTEGCGTCEFPSSCNGDGATPYQCSQPACTPLTCDDLRADTDRFPNGVECGFYGDGCGGTAVDASGEPGCGQCPDGASCGGGGPGVCGQPCTPSSCVDVIMPADGKTVCGVINDGCGLRNCGECKNPGDLCGADTPNVCDPGPACTPMDCFEIALHLGRPIECGQVGDGCGGVQDCGECTEPGDTCGGGGDPNVCSPGDFTCEDNRTCAEILGVTGAEAMNLCGSVGNDCGELVQCGVCPPGSMCGREQPYRCGCVPLPANQACASADAQCGAVDDGCGGVVECGDCPGGSICSENKCSTII